MKCYFCNGPEVRGSIINEFKICKCNYILLHSNCMNKLKTQKSKCRICNLSFTFDNEKQPYRY
jgi:hypothetical protein